MRAKSQQLFGVVANGVVILARDLERHQVGKRLFRTRVAAQQVQINFGRFVHAASLLQRHGFAEQNFLTVRILAQMSIEGFKRLLGIFQM